MKISFEEYEIILEEINEDIEDGAFELSSTIQIQRDVHDINGYHKIIDWFHDHETTLRNLEIDPFDSDTEMKEKNDMMRYYLLVRPLLETISVENLIKELKEGASIVSLA